MKEMASIERQTTEVFKYATNSEAVDMRQELPVLSVGISGTFSGYTIDLGCIHLERDGDKGENKAEPHVGG
jgi:hypothetical protein